MSLIGHAERELSLVGSSDDPMQERMNAHILKMVQLFSEEGHSGFSASYAIGILTKLLSFEPLTPLTGEDSEWMEVGTNMWQNIRCGHVFKDDQGARDAEGKIFEDETGMRFTSKDSAVAVEFPYSPKREIVKVKSEASG